MTKTGAFLLTGATGFIGASVLQALRAAAPQRALIVAGRSNSGPMLPKLQRCFIDLAAPTFELPRDVDTVLHMAGEKRDPAHMWAVNYSGTVRLVEAAAHAGARCFVHLSSCGVYGAPMNAGVIDEGYAHTPQNVYESSKDAGERAVLERCAALGLRCVVLQPSNVIGAVPGSSYPLLGLMSSISAGRFVYFGGGEPWVNYVAVEDVTRAIAAIAVDDDAEGVFIVNTPAPLRELVGWIAEELKCKAPSMRLPLWLGAVLAGSAALVRRGLQRELPLSPERFRELTNTTRYDGSAITRRVGFTYPFGIERMVRSLARTYRAEARL